MHTPSIFPQLAGIGLHSDGKVPGKPKLARINLSNPGHPQNSVSAFCDGVRTGSVINPEIQALCSL